MLTVAHLLGLIYRKMLRRHNFVGVVDEDFSLIQFNTKLLLVRHNILVRELVYQEVLRSFSHCPRLRYEIRNSSRIIFQLNQKD